MEKPISELIHNMAFERDAPKAARPSTLRWAPSLAAKSMLRLTIFITAFALSSQAIAASTLPISMRVVESGTNMPVAGAKVRYFAKAWEGTLTGHGGQTATMFDIQGESDINGNILLPPAKFNPRIFGIFGMNTNYGNAAMTITKNGYEPLQLSNYLRIFPNLDEVIAWEFQGRTVELKPTPKVGHTSDNK